MEHFSFTLVDGRGASYLVNTDDDMSVATLTFQFKKANNQSWQTSNLVTVAGEAAGVRLSVSAVNSNSVLAPTFYRVQSSETTVLTGQIYLYYRSEV